MTAVQPVSPEPTAPGGGAPAAAPGFDDALAGAQARLGPETRLTLGQMVGLAPPPAGGAIAGAGGLQALSATPSPGSADGHPAVAAAKEYLGVPYLWGGTDPSKGLDCSGFVQRAFADVGVSLPRVSADQARAGEAVGSLAEARAGDLVYWSGGGSRPNHIGIYLGDGKMLHAPRSGDVVKVDDVRSAPPTTIRRVG